MSLPAFIFLRGSSLGQVTAEARPVNRTKALNGGAPPPAEHALAIDGTATELLVRRSGRDAVSNSCETWLKVTARTSRAATRLR